MSVNARVLAATRRINSGALDETKTDIVYKVTLRNGDQHYTDEPDIDSAFGEDVTGVLVMKLASGVFITGNSV